MASHVQVGSNNINNIHLNEWDGNTHVIHISNGGVIVVRLHGGQEVSTGASEVLHIRITMRINDMNVELGMLDYMQNDQAFLDTLVDGTFEGHVSYNSVSLGSIIIELKPETDDSVISVLESLRSGKFVEMLSRIFNRIPDLKVTTERSLELDVDFEIPDQLIKKEKRAFESMEEKLQTFFLEADIKERAAKIESCARMRAVSEEIQQATKGVTATRIFAAGVVFAGAILAVPTNWLSMLASGASAVTAVTVATAITDDVFKKLADSRAQKDAQVAVDKYKDAIRGYSQVLQQAHDASARHKAEAMRYVDEINDPERRRLLKMYFEDASTVHVSDDFIIRVKTYQVTFLEFILMKLFGHIFNVLNEDASYAAMSINYVASQVEAFKILQEA